MTRSNTNMTTSNKGVLFLASHEGVVYSPYYDVKRILTFGIGHTAYAGSPDPKKLDMGKKYDIEYILEVFTKDLRRFEERVNRALKVDVTQAQFDALVSFDYNTGGVLVADLMKSLNAGRVDDAGREIMNWRKPRSIIKRRKAEQQLFVTNKYPERMIVNTYETDGRGNIVYALTKRLDLARYIKP